LERVEEELRRTPLAVARGGPYDRWDLEVAASSGIVRLRAAVEEHGRGRQMFRFHVWPRLTTGRAVVIGALVGLIALSWREGLVSIAPLAALAGVAVGHAAWELAVARGAIDTALRLARAGDENLETAVVAPELPAHEGVLGVDVALAVADPSGSAIT
jgi:hypothetical protein